MRGIFVDGIEKLDAVMNKMYPDVHGPIVVRLDAGTYGSDQFRVYYEPEFNFPIDDVGEKWDDESGNLVE